MFSSADDLAMARLACATVPADTKVTLVVSSRDYDAAVREGIRADAIEKADFNKGSTLNGAEAVLNVCDWLSRLCGDSDRVLKLDADTLLFKPEEMMSDGLRGFVHPTSPAGVMGLCYSMSNSTAFRLRETAESWMRRGWKPGAEDQAIGAIVLSLGERDNRMGTNLLYWERYDTHAANRNHVAGHYRWREGARRFGVEDTKGINRISLNAMMRDFEVLGMGRRS